MAGSMALNGPSSMIAACRERHPTSWLFAINRFPFRTARPCVSSTRKTGSFDEMENIGVCSIIGPSRMIKRNLIRTLARICGSLLIVAGVTTFYFFIFDEANTTTVGFTFLVAILGIATAWGLPEAIVASVAGVLCFNLFFLPPLFTLVIEDTQNWVALFAFLVTAVVASQLSASVKRRAMEATRQREEVERLYELSRALMLVEK